MRVRSLSIAILVAAVNVVLWIWGNLAQQAADSAYPVQGLSYNPFQRDQDPFRGDVPSLDGIKSDLEVLARKTKSVRLYSSRGFDELPVLLQDRGMTMIASAWLGSDPDENKLEVEAAIKLAGRNRAVRRLIIGNETQLKNTVPLDELVAYLAEARRRLRTPVSTAEPWDYWIKHPELADHVDFIAVHILPYWMEVPVENAVDYVFEKYAAVRLAFPGRVAMIAETGWPSDGPQRGAAEATLAAQAQFVREFVGRSNQQQVLYNIIEAFDQPWKSAIEGRAGENFGIMDAYRADKFPMTGVIQEDPNWEVWLLSSLVLGLLFMIMFLSVKSDLRLRAQIFGAVVLQACASSIVQLAREASAEYMSPGDIVFWTIVVGAQALLAIILLTDTAEIADVVGRRPLRRVFPVARRRPQDPAPFVSIHVACCREPPALVIETVEHLARLDYPNFEILVIDNNTDDEQLWRPVEARCKELGERVRFVSLGSWPGFKAGALNFALQHSDPRAEIIGVVDADYVVDRNWLNGTVPYFSDTQVGLVQAPQEHRDFDHNLFQVMENYEYCGFFRIGMVQRNEDNAIIQHGTMTLMRRSLLDRVGGWAEWCICEDTELGLRLLCEGAQAVYIDHPFGHGLVPDSYEAYKKQRFRWAYGGIRILRRHWKVIFGISKGLTRAQRYQFIKGWLPWIGDALHLFFTMAALGWTGLLLAKPLETDFPEPIFIYPAFALVLMRLLGTAWTYATRVRVSSERILLAMVAGGSLTHVIAKAVFQGFLISGKPFYRTPKLDRASPVLRSLASCGEEFVLLLLLLGGAAGILITFGVENDMAVLWSIGMCVQSLPYLAAFLASLVSATARGQMRAGVSKLSASAGLSQAPPSM